MGGRVWTEAEDAQIRAAMGHFGELAAVGRRINRSPGAVRVRAHVLRQAGQGIEPEAAGIEHGQAHAPPVPDVLYRPAPPPPGISAEEFERRVNEHVEKLRAQQEEERS